MLSHHLLLFFLFFHGFFSVPAFGTNNTMQFELIHRHTGSPLTHFERVNDLIHVDNHRVRMISQRVGRNRRKDLEAAGIYPMNSGAYKGTGQYLVPFRVGTPSQRFLLVVDTGSDLTWMKCRYRCKNCPRRIKRRRIFHAAQSSSFEAIPCSSQMCQTLPFSLSQCSTPMSPCLFDYRCVYQFFLICLVLCISCFLIKSLNQIC